MTGSARPEALQKKIVIIESPFGTRPGSLHGERATPLEMEINRAYLDACIFDSLKRGEAPIASHKMYVDCLNDALQVERETGMAAGFALMRFASAQAVYEDLGITSGMLAGMNAWTFKDPRRLNQERRLLGPEAFRAFAEERAYIRLYGSRKGKY